MPSVWASFGGLRRGTGESVRHGKYSTGKLVDNFCISGAVRLGFVGQLSCRSLPVSITFLHLLGVRSESTGRGSSYGAFTLHSPISSCAIACLSREDDNFFHRGVSLIHSLTHLSLALRCYALQKKNNKKTRAEPRSARGVAHFGRLEARR